MVLALFGCVSLGASINIPGFEQPEESWPAELLAGISSLAMLKGAATRAPPSS
jgi:hypothetical protein